MGKIKVVIADDSKTTRDNIKKLLSFVDIADIVAEAADGNEAIEQTKKFKPDILLLDINMPKLDGISAAKLISTQVPETSIVIMSVQGEQEYLRKAMVAGAKNYLIKPFTTDELSQAIKEVYENEKIRKSNVDQKPLNGKIITVFSCKGGVGKTTIAVNLAGALANLSASVGMVDANLQFGDVALFTNIVPRQTISDLASYNDITQEILADCLSPSGDNIKVLAAPLRPEQAETITSSLLASAIKTLQTMCDFVIIDTSSAFNDINLTLFDISDHILIVGGTDLATVKNTKLSLEIMGSLGFSNKISLLLNRANSVSGMSQKEVEAVLTLKFSACFPSDGKVAIEAVNDGKPFINSHPLSQLSISIATYAKTFAQSIENKPVSVVKKLSRWFS